MSERSQLYSSESYSTAVEMESAPSLSLPGIHRELLCRALAPSAEWRFPIYRDWWKRRELLDVETGAEAGVFSRLKRAIMAPFRGLARTSYIEWRYYSVLSREFHGIIGAALFNPEGRFSSLAESGLLVIVAGVAGAAEAQAAEFCWMKLFPTHALSFSSENPGCLVACHDGIEFRINHHDPGAANITLEGRSAPSVRFEMASVPGTSVRPAWGEDLKRMPGAHWVVHNAAPMAKVNGQVTLTPSCWETGAKPSRRFPSLVSPSVADALSRGSLTLSLEGTGYYEHSFGMNPMPLHGWDFCFAPDLEGRRAIVMQTYPRSEELRYLEVFWEEGGQSKYVRFPSSSLKMEWEKSMRHPEIRADVPVVRRIRASWGGYSIEIENRIDHRIPFLRPEKFFVRHFFISEEMGRTSWVLRDASGNVISEARDVLSGGETAHVRVPT